MDLKDENGELYLGQQFSHLSNNYYKGDGDNIMDDPDAPTNIRVDSPDPNKLNKAKLEIEKQQMSEVEGHVLKFVRQNSLIKEA